MDEHRWLASSDPVAMMDFLCAGKPAHRRPSERKVRLFYAAWWRVATPHTPEHEEMISVVEDGRAWTDPVDGKKHTLETVARDCCTFHGKNRERGAPILRCIVGNPYRPISLCGNTECREAATHLDHGSVTVRPSCPACRRLRTPTVLAIAQAAYEDRGSSCKECKGSGFFDRKPGDWDVRCMHCKGTGRAQDGRLSQATLSVLADALEDAGCTLEPLLRHLRGQAPCPRCLRHGDAGTCSLCGGTTGLGPTLNWTPSHSPHYRGCHALDAILGAL